MLPDVVFLGIDLYYWMIGVGLFAAIVCFRVFCDAMKLPTKPFNFFLIVVIGAVAVGFFAAVLVQSLYNFIATGVWEWQGMTFLGGLAGGVLCFFLFYFLIGNAVFKDGAHRTYFLRFVCCALPCIVLAHAFGRIGCLFAGCCYGMRSDTFGLPMKIGGVWENRIPAQLFEALFLFALFAVLMYLVIGRDDRHIPQIYLIAYGVWRFFIEFFRDDPRGSVGISFLTPSQLLSLLMIVAGVVLLIVYHAVRRRTREKTA